MKKNAMIPPCGWNSAEISGLLMVRIYKAILKESTRMFTKMSPYCIIKMYETWLLILIYRGDVNLKTPIARNQDSNPVWDNTFTWNIPHKVLESGAMTVELWDS